MPLQNGSIAEGATISAAGGSAHTFTTDGLKVTDGIHLIDASITDFRARTTMTAKTKQPVLAADGTYGKGKRSLTIAFPKVLASGKQGFPLIRIELEDFPELTDAEKTKMLNYGAQSLFDTDFQAFWLTGSQA